MTIRRIVAIVVIFAAACVGWAILGATTTLRSNTYFQRLSAQVGDLWGQPLNQRAPSLGVQIPGSTQLRWIMPSANHVRVELTPDYRKKGLIWYPTFICRFNGRYTLTNLEEVTQKVRLHFDFPDPQATYDEFVALVDDRPLTIPIDPQQGIDHLLALPPGKSTVFAIRYLTRGTWHWRYQPDPHTGRIKNLKLALHTAFKNVDYTQGSLSPTTVERVDNGMRLVWEADDLITQANMGVVVPEKLNPGPVTSRITFFAPVCLIFFFVLLTTIGIVRRIAIHPMHYLFVAAGFFAFHLLLAYLVAHIHIHLAFVLSAAISVALVSAYLSAALQKRFPWKVAAAGQLFYLVLFSYSFFLRGMTGLTVALGSVVTLAALMKVTAPVDWERVFKKKNALEAGLLSKEAAGT